MRLHHGWSLLPIFCLSCTTLGLTEPAGEPRKEEAALPAKREEGIHAESAPAALVTSPNHLRLAVSCLDRGRVSEACSHLADFLQEHPEQTLVRSRYAGLLVRLRRLPAARLEFGRVLAEAQEDSPELARNLIHSHRRLMEIATAGEDDYAEHLHRGIGLYLLARERQRVGGSGDELPAEPLLCKAAAELTLAQVNRGSEAQPAWYLYRVWSQLGQHQAARKSLRDAVRSAPFAYLTPDEQRGVYAAEQQLSLETERP